MADNDDGIRALARISSELLLIIVVMNFFILLGTWFLAPGFNHNSTIYDFQCGILNNEQKLFSNYFNSGNYTFNFTAVFTPVFEIGPYWVKGTPQQINYQWYMTIIT